MRIDLGPVGETSRSRLLPHGKRSRSGYRRAGACPPRSFQAPERGGPRLHPRIRAGFPRDRGTARDRPSPYGNRGRPGYRRAGALGCHTRIRAGSPRDRCYSSCIFHEGCYHCQNSAKTEIKNDAQHQTDTQTDKNLLR